MDVVLRLESPAGTRDLSRPDVEALGSSASFARVEELVPAAEGVTHATFHAADGYAATIPLEQARADAVLEVPDRGEAKVGVRLLVGRGGTTCLNVKAVTRIELSVGPGKHTVDPNPHTPARVPGWDRPGATA